MPAWSICILSSSTEVETKQWAPARCHRSSSTRCRSVSLPMRGRLTSTNTTVPSVTAMMSGHPAEYWVPGIFRARVFGRSLRYASMFLTIVFSRGGVLAMLQQYHMWIQL